MQNLSTQAISCIGKCTSGLSTKELDRKTDNIHLTLSNREVRKIFAKFLETRPNKKSDKECLELYNICCTFTEQENNSSEPRKEPSLEELKALVERVKNMAEFLDDIPELDMVVMESLVKAIRSESRSDMLEALEYTKEKCEDHFREDHPKFKKYVLQPCPFGQ